MKFGVERTSSVSNVSHLLLLNSKLVNFSKLSLIIYKIEIIKPSSKGSG